MRSLLWLGALCALSLACSDGADTVGGGNGDDGSVSTGGSSSAGGTGGSGLDLDPDGPDVPGAESYECYPGQAAAAGCGDGVLAEGEACDDGNQADGDGCAANCLCVEPGYSCNPPGVACSQVAVCGDGVLVFPELCDDGNTTPGDGCAINCQFEVGYKCAGNPSVCTATICGDGVVEGAETCDDGNSLPFDGCSALCQGEPDCAAGACTSTCGDGIVIDEQCDDGNGNSGDGCSATCEQEPGYMCSSNSACDAGAADCVLDIPAVFRDWTAAHPDFETGQGDGVLAGMVQASLGPDGKPVPTGLGNNASALADWFRDGAGRSTIVGSVRLYPNGAGGFVNRWGPNGERWSAYTNPVWAASASSGQCEGCLPCSLVWGSGNTDWCTMDLVEFDGNPFFFPLDDHPLALPDTRTEAKLPPEYGGNWQNESEVNPNYVLHNFHFTTEIQYWFPYDPSTPATLEFTGDDDVWVFVNGQLAVDLGGLHPPETGAVTIDATNSFGMTAGGIYPISVFHVERKTTGSSFKLTLSGFSAARSLCTADCGDGVVGLGEQCDDGVNDGGYGECSAGCVLGEYCGDGVVQDGEDCDDGNSIDGDACGSGCRNIILR